jgi:hypothetical protein
MVISGHRICQCYLEVGSNFIPTYQYKGNLAPPSLFRRRRSLNCTYAGPKKTVCLYRPIKPKFMSFHGSLREEAVRASHYQSGY